jgi:hypothetical protein
VVYAGFARTGQRQVCSLIAVRRSPTAHLRLYWPLSIPNGAAGVCQGGVVRPEASCGVEGLNPRRRWGYTHRGAPRLGLRVEQQSCAEVMSLRGRMGQLERTCAREPGTLSQAPPSLREGAGERQRPAQDLWFEAKGCSRLESSRFRPVRHNTCLWNQLAASTLKSARNDHTPLWKSKAVLQLSHPVPNPEHR